MSILVYVLSPRTRPPANHRNLSNGGLSAHFDKLYFVPKLPSADLSELTMMQQRRAVHLVVRDLAYGVYLHVEPIHPCPPDRVGYMFGGSYIEGDARFASAVFEVCGVRPLYPLPLHDRTEGPHS